MRLVIVHDVLGTLFGLEEPIAELQRLFGAQVANARFAETIVMDWYLAAQRDFCMISVGGEYKPIGAVFKSILPRVLLMAGLVPPERGDDIITTTTNSAAGAGLPQGEHYSMTDSETGQGNPFGKHVTDAMMGSLQRLTSRPGMKEAFTKTYKSASERPLHVSDVEVWGATNGGLALAQTLFKRALGEGTVLHTGDVRDHEGGDGVFLFSCDEIKVAKPARRVYEEVKRRSSGGDGDDKDVQRWFVASHTWDLFSAKLAGFKTAWVTYEEFDASKDIYGTPDIVAKDLNEAAKAIFAFEAKVHDER